MCPVRRGGNVPKAGRHAFDVERVSWQEATEIAICTLATGENGVNAMQRTFIEEFLKAAKQAPRIYFAPVLGAFNGIKAELKRLNSLP
jgi:hypothetical protein